VNADNDEAYQRGGGRPSVGAGVGERTALGRKSKSRSPILNGAGRVQNTTCPSHKDYSAQEASGAHFPHVKLSSS
jgi:hypothetical protein